MQDSNKDSNEYFTKATVKQITHPITDLRKIEDSMPDVANFGLPHSAQNVFWKNMFSVAADNQQ